MRGTACIEHTQKRGYGTGRWRGRVCYLHRIAYAKAHGLDPFDMGGVVMHSCDNPRCINPEHLTLGTYAENTQDMLRKGRDYTPTGEDHYASRLTAEDVIAIRKRYIPRCRINGCRALGHEYNVGNHTISDIVSYKTWKEVA